jgi:hypothetical protein
MNNSSKTNTILLVILIIIALGIVFLQVSGKAIFSQKQSVIEETNQQQVPQNQVQNTGVTQPAVNQNPTQPKNNVANLDNSLVALDMSSEVAKTYRTKLTEALGQPANFNGHYVVITVGCGTGCDKYLVVDKNTGKAYQGPTNDYGITQLAMGGIQAAQPMFSLSSNIIKAIGIGIVSYEFNGKEFIKK